MINRISLSTRWPLDERQRIERARRDIDFADVMTKIMGSDESLRRIALVAQTQIFEIKTKGRTTQ